MGRGKKEELVWKYLLKNRLATPTEVAKATGVSYGYAHKLMQRIGTPRKIFEKDVQTDFEKAIKNAPIREPVNVWTDRIWQVAIMLAVLGVVSLWLLMAW